MIITNCCSQNSSKIRFCEWRFATKEWYNLGIPPSLYKK